jgi:iron complex outermembrane receptor protein
MWAAQQRTSSQPHRKYFGSRLVLDYVFQFKWARLLGMAALVGVGSHAFAQTETDPKTLSKIRVEESAEKEAEYAPKRASSATRTDTALIEIPQSISVITAEQIREQSSPNLQEALRYAPGVRNELYGIDNRGDWVSLRGSEESTIFLDGMRLPLTGWYGVVRIEPYAYERIDVLRGPSSIIAGANDPGGVVSLVSKRPTPDAFNEVEVQVGNFDLQQVGLDSGGPLNDAGTLLYRFVAVGKQSDTQIDLADEERALVAPSLTWQFGDAGSLTTYAEYQYDRSKNTNAFLGLEGTLYPAPNGPIPRDVFIGEPDWDTYGGTRYRFGYALDSEIARGWQLRHNLRHDDVEGLMESLYAAWWDGFVDANGDPDPNGQYLGRPWYIYDDSSRVTTTDVLAEGFIETGRVGHTLLFGADGMLHDSSQTSASGTGTPLNVYAPVYGTFARPSITTETPDKNEIRRVGIFVQDQMKIAERLSVRAGLRRDMVRNAVIGGDVEKDWATSVNVGVVYEVIPGLAPYASYSESFNPVAGVDGNGRGYKPKRAEQLEGGLKWESQTLPVQATLSYFTLEERNRLANDPNNPFGPSVQIGKARIRGGELEARADLASWSLLGSYTYTRVRASATAFGGDLDPDEQLEGIPEQMASLWAIHDFTSVGLPGFRFGGGVRHVDRIGDGTGEVFVPSVILWDAMASYDTGSWRFALNANNLTDKSYIATCLARGDCWFGQRRRLVGSVTYRW